jgi:hypothetical protein
MNISFNVNPSNLISSNSATSKMEFVKNYGTLSGNYNNLTPLGEQKNVWFYFVLILSLILTGVFFHLSREERDASGNVKEKTTSKKIYKILAWMFVGVSSILAIYSGYMYLFVYSPQYNEWFNSLPKDARTQLNIIKNLDIIADNARNYNRSNNRNNRGFINISY